jgi:hypothetical protein
MTGNGDLQSGLNASAGELGGAMAVRRVGVEHFFGGCKNSMKLQREFQSAGQKICRPPRLPRRSGHHHHAKLREKVLLPAFHCSIPPPYPDSFRLSLLPVYRRGQQRCRQLNFSIPRPSRGSVPLDPHRNNFANRFIETRRGVEGQYLRWRGSAAGMDISTGSY